MTAIQVEEALPDSDPLTEPPRETALPDTTESEWWAAYKQDDGIIDPVAIDMAVQGKRRIRLTRRECAQAVARLEASGMSPGEISGHLGVPLATISEIMQAAAVSAAA